MRQLLPTPLDTVDPLTLYPLDDRPRPADRPWLMANMVASVDGAIAIDGVSAGLGGEGDSMAFRAIRASCDWIVAAAGTVRAERYQIPRTSPEIAAVRSAQGRDTAPRLAVVSASVDLDPDLPLFADRRDGEAKPLVITGATPPPERVAALDGLAEWHHTDTERPTSAAILAALGERGADVVLAEGGPTFNGQLVDAGLLDELCLSISPHLVGGGSSRIVNHSTTTIPADLRLDRLLEHDSALFARYVRA
ncbi:MAG: dihydrofolate reductase family protein [Actinomycetota bacterium]